MFTGVAAVAEDGLIVVAGELQRGGHLLGGDEPVAELVIEIVGAILHEHADRLGVAFGLADHEWVIVAAADVVEAADMAEDFAKSIGPIPGDGEGADAAGADAADGATFRVVGELIGFADFRENLFDQETGVLIGERVVFEAAIGNGPAAGRGGGLRSGIDEDADGDRHLPGRDQVVEDDWDAEVAFLIDVTRAILEDHHAGGSLAVILCGDVDPVIARGAGEDFGVVP